MQQTQSPNEPDFLDKIERWQSQALYPALPVMLITREHLGSDLINVPRLIAVFSVMIVLAYYAAPANDGYDLMVFIVISIASSIRQHSLRSKELRSGQADYSSDFIGDTVFKDPRFLPRALTDARRAERFLEPALVFGLGWYLKDYSGALGSYLMIAGVSIRVFEAYIRKMDRRRAQIVANAMVESRIHAQLVDYFSRGQRAKSGQAMREDALPTGVSGDLPSGQAPQRERSATTQQKSPRRFSLKLKSFLFKKGRNHKQ